MRLIRVGLDHLNAIVAAGDDLRFRVVARSADVLGPLRIGQSIKTPDGACVGTSFGHADLMLEPGVDTVFDLVVPRPPLAPGHYVLSLSIGYGDETSGVRDLDRVHDTVQFEMAPAIDNGGTVSTWNRGWGPTRFERPQILSVTPPRATAP